MQNNANNVIHKVHQNGENHFSNHRIQNKDPTSLSEKSHVSNKLSKFQLDLMVNEARTFILPRGQRLEK